MSFDYVLEDFIDHRVATIHNFFGALHGFDIPTLNQATDHKWLVKFDRHLFRKTTLMKLQLRAYHNHGSTRIINSLSKQILTETATFPFEHIAQRLECTIVVSNRIDFLRIVVERID